MSSGDTQALVRQHMSIGEETLTEIRSFEIETQYDCDLVGQAINEAHTRVDILDSTRKKLVSPIDAARRAVQDLFAPPLALWRSVEVEGKARIAEYVESECARKADEDRRVVAAVSVAGAVDAAVSVACVADTPPRAVPTGVTLVTRWDAEVTDLRALVCAIARGEAPLELVRADDSAVRIYARTHRDSAPLPGVRIYPVQSVRTK